MNDVLRQLLSVAPGLAAGLKGNGVAMREFMDAYQQTSMQLQAQRERQQLMTQRGEDRQLAAQDRERLLKEHTEDRAAKQTQQGQADALQRLAIPGQLAQLGGGAETPQDAQRLIESAMPGLMSAFGQETMAIGQPAVEMATQTITARQKRQVKEFVDQALKTSHVAENPDADPVITNLPAHVVRVLGRSEAKLSELQAFADLPVGKPQSKPSDDVSLQSKEMLVNGVPTVVNYNPKTGAYTDQSGKPVTAGVIPPREPAGSGGAYPPATQRRIDAIVKGFDAQPVVKTIQKQAEAVTFADSLDPNTTNPADDQALIYAFAKAMDPDSVVREGEYATVQKYAQSWAQTFGFNAARVFSNTQFLTPQSRANMKNTIRAKYAAGRKQYDNLRSEYGRKIDRITQKSGTGVDELTDFGAAFPQLSPEKAPDAPAGTKPARGTNPFRPK